jgi:hypothetical protein
MEDHLPPHMRTINLYTYGSDAAFHDGERGSAFSSMKSYEITRHTTLPCARPGRAGAYWYPWYKVCGELRWQRRVK